MSPTISSRGLRALVFAFSLSQFFRSCLAVMAPELQRDLGLSPAGFGLLSSCFFLAFAVAQIPVGIAFDRFGVGAPTRWLLAVGVGSALLFALAPGGGTAMLAQVGLGLACAPVFMGLMHYAAENVAPDRHVAFMGRSNAIGMLGALCATWPLGWVAHQLGWRVAIGAAALCMLAACVGVWRHVHDAGHAEARRESPTAMLAASARLLAVPALWTLIPMCVGLAAGTTFRNAWGGPYFAAMFGLDADARGLALTGITLASFATALMLPRLVRRSSLRATVIAVSVGSGSAALVLAAWPGGDLVSHVVTLAVVVMIGMLHPLVMTHGRQLLAPAVRGRGLGLLNSFVFLGSAFAAWAFGQVADAGLRADWSPGRTWTVIFGSAAALVLLGLLPYLLSPRCPQNVGQGQAPR